MAAEDSKGGDEGAGFTGFAGFASNGLLLASDNKVSGPLDLNEAGNLAELEDAALVARMATRRGPAASEAPTPTLATVRDAYAATRARLSGQVLTQRKLLAQFKTEMEFVFTHARAAEQLAAGKLPHGYPAPETGAKAADYMRMLGKKLTDTANKMQVVANEWQTACNTLGVIDRDIDRACGDAVRLAEAVVADTSVGRATVSLPTVVSLHAAAMCENATSGPGTTVSGAGPQTSTAGHNVTMDEVFNSLIIAQ